MADGGERTVDDIRASRGGWRGQTTVTGALGDPVDAEWAILGDGTAIVEMARASGHGGAVIGRLTGDAGWHRAFHVPGRPARPGGSAHAVAVHATGLFEKFVLPTTP